MYYSGYGELNNAYFNDFYEIVNDLPPNANVDIEIQLLNYILQFFSLIKFEEEALFEKNNFSSTVRKTIRSSYRLQQFLSLFSKFHNQPFSSY